MKKLVTGYVVRISKYKENDAIISVLTKKGIESFKARAMYKPNNKNAHALNLYSYGEYNINYKIEGGNGTLISASLLSFVDKMYVSLDYALLFGVMGEIANKYDGFFDVFDYIFKNIDSIDVYVAIIYCLKYILEKEGTLPIGDKCVKCGTKENIENLSFIEGGFICHSCNETNITIDSKILHDYHVIYKMQLEHLKNVKIEEKRAIYFIDLFYEYIESSLGIKLVSKNVFQALK